MNQNDVLIALRTGPKTPSEILDVLDPDARSDGMYRTRLQSVQEKLRSLQKWGMVESVDRKSDGYMHSKVWRLTSKGMEGMR